jgi:plastocyanin
VHFKNLITFFTYPFISLILLISLSACQPDTGPEPDEPIPPTGVEVSIFVSDQNIEFATILIDEVVMPVDGWLVIHSDENGQPGEVVGVEALEPGIYRDVGVGIDTVRATDTLHAMLHFDAGQVGEFEYLGPDEPLTTNGEPVMATFRVELLRERPIEPQEPAEPVVVRITDNNFDPQQLTVVPGTIVVWVNEGSGSHTVTSDAGLFDSGVLAPGMDFEFTFRDSGEYSYYCQLHGSPGEGMAGTITVAHP